jgi:hypothetical protein
MMFCNLTEQEMPVVVLALVGLIGLTMIPATAGAFPSVSNKMATGSNLYYREIAQGCGPGFHWVGKHRNRYGSWVPGHCARN